MVAHDAQLVKTKQAMREPVEAESACDGGALSAARCELQFTALRSPGLARLKDISTKPRGAPVARVACCVAVSRPHSMNDAHRIEMFRDVTVMKETSIVKITFSAKVTCS